MDVQKGGFYPRRVTDENTTEIVIDRLLMALAAQLGAAGEPALTAGAAEALADLSRAEAQLIFGAAGHLVHCGADTGPLETLIDRITTLQRPEAPADAVVKAGDRVRLVGELPESLADYDETWVRETVFVVRFVGRDPRVEVQPDLAEDYLIAAVPAAGLELVH
jgi:hypothetical protein